jgi:hypothetical protein
MAQARVAFAAAADSAEFSVRVRLEEQLQSAVHRYVRKLRSPRTTASRNLRLLPKTAFTRFSPLQVVEPEGRLRIESAVRAIASAVPKAFSNRLVVRTGGKEPVLDASECAPHWMRPRPRLRIP